MARKYRQGQFKPTNPKKYKGNVSNIIYRSSWELIVFKWLDHKANCIEWSSEETIIPYRSPVDEQVHRYFVDIKATFVSDDGKKTTVLIEIKPYAQTIQPVSKQGKNKRVLMEEMATYAVNSAKWDAAEAYCRKMGYVFMILTEYEIGLKKRKS